MDDLDRLRGSDDARAPLEEPLTTYRPSRAPLIGLGVLLVVVALGLWWWLPASTPAAPATTPAPALQVTAPAATPSGLGAGAADPNLPDLGSLDAYVRPLLAVLSTRPELAALLTSDNLVRRFVVSVEAVARGASPARQVRAVAPRGAFAVTRDNGAIVIDPASFDRYDGLVRMARLYGRLKPRLEDAHAELGVAGTMDETMVQAIRHLLATPDLPAVVRVQPGKGTNYTYSDPAIEGLSAAQRQLLRLGPARATQVKAHLRRFGEALGIPPARLAG